MIPFYEQKRPITVYYQQRLDFPMHLHDAIEIVYALEGSSTVVCDGRRYSLAPGDLFFAFPNQVHGYENTQNFDGFVIIITTKTLDIFRSVLEQQRPARPVIHPTEKAAESLLQLLKMMHTDRHSASMPLMQGYGQVLLAKLLPMVEPVSGMPQVSSLQNILHYINTHYTEPLTRKEIALALGYSESHISHTITATMGTNLMGYITLLRLEDARRLLKETSLPIGQIAMSLGFPSIRSFNRFFQKEMQMTPTQWRTES
ncbi:MAG: helix-turn-helix transcriptional regulator [Oscillospiraceae bacterium]|nr:helix-turn-helix transcriptional regulator [Oscillospiraceae bacterium]